MGLRRALTIVGSLVGGALAMLLLSSCNPTPTRYLVVTTTADGRDAAPGNGVCEVTPGQGDCSLRAAVDEANITTARVDIAVPAGTYRLTVVGVGVEDDNRSGDLDLHSPSPSVGIHSSGSGAVIDSSGVEGALDISSGSVGTVFISVTGTVPDPADNGTVGVLARGSSSVTLFGGTISHNTIGTMVAPGASLRTSYVQLIDNFYYGVFNQSTAMIEHTLISGSTAAGILFDFGPAVTGTVRDSIIRGNGGPNALVGGGIVSANLFDRVVADLTVERTTIDHNRGKLGGGIVFGIGHLSVSDSTISENSSELQPAGLVVDVATVPSNPGESRFVVTRSTIVDNHWDRGPSASQIGSRPGTVEVSGSIIGGADDDCAAPLVSGGHNLATDASCGLAQSTDRLAVDLLLGPLAFNGGLTPTRMPDADSAAVDAIPVGTAGLCDDSTPPDQRGIVRPVGSACDIGAAERDVG